MKPFRLTLALVFIIAFTLIACSEDDTTTNPEDGVPDDVNSGNVCDQELCGTNEALQDECQDFYNTCIENDVGSGEECVAGAWMICNG
jgi:hypothetical protein